MFRFDRLYVCDTHCLLERWTEWRATRSKFSRSALVFERYASETNDFLYLFFSSFRPGSRGSYVSKSLSWVCLFTVCVPSVYQTRYRPGRYEWREKIMRCSVDDDGSSRVSSSVSDPEIMKTIATPTTAGVIAINGVRCRLWRI